MSKGVILYPLKIFCLWCLGINSQ